MAERIYYVFCEDNCKFESMTKEQIITAIAEATGKTPTAVDAAFITKIKEQNANVAVKIWVGTQAEFNALTEKDANTIYYYDDTDVEDLTSAIENIVNGTTPVAEAKHALKADEATKATNANYATSAGSASSATSATRATNATNAAKTDFTNARVSGGVKASNIILSENGTYNFWIGGYSPVFGIIRYTGTPVYKLTGDDEYFYLLKILDGGKVQLYKMAIGDTVWEENSDIILYYQKIR